MHRYRSHTCGALRDSHIDQTVRLSGWCHRIRDHGGVLFIDLRDHYGHHAMRGRPGFAGLRRLLKSCAPNGSSASTARCAARPAGTENPRTADRRRSKSMSRDIEVLGPLPPNCRCRCSAIRIIPKRRG